MYGWRLRIGLIIPSSNTTMEPEFSLFTPDGISIHSCRLPLEKVTENELAGMENNLQESSKLLSHVNPEVIAFGCTTGSLIKGKGYDTKLEEKIQSSTGIPAVATARAVLKDLREHQINDVAIVTPYTDEINEKEKQFFIENGFNVRKITGLNLAENKKIGEQPPDKTYRLGKKVANANPECDGIFISCTNFRTFGILSTLEDDIGKKVVSSNQATLRTVLKECGISNQTEFFEQL